MQSLLKPDQVAAFYHSEFVTQQIEHFGTLIGKPPSDASKVLLDVGGGQGYFAAAAMKAFGLRCRVIDTDPVGVQTAKEQGVEAMCDDALNPTIQGDESVVCFNLILHHLVGSTERSTRDLQIRAIHHWAETSSQIFVNEYIYESYIGNFSGNFIYKITKSRILSAVGSFVARFVPSLKANTFGVGVRFRSNTEWKHLFKEAGYAVVSEKLGEPEHVSPARRLLLIREIRRDSFLLRSLLAS
jgi:SAM-dependent methyltransferase